MRSTRQRMTVLTICSKSPKWSLVGKSLCHLIGLLIVCALCSNGCINSGAEGWWISSLARLRQTSDDLASQNRRCEMLRGTFDPNRPYQAVKYLRMSGDEQNKRSPDQQDDTIERVLERMGYPWHFVKVYRDEAKSGRYLRSRPAYQRMLRELKSGLVQANIIAVDTMERFGRVEELPTIRKELFEQHAVLVLAANANFCDPLSPQGRALAAVESIRCAEDGYAKAHNVLRGKYDSITRGFWPGGPVPFGLALELVETEYRRKRKIEHYKLVHNVDTAWIIERLFKLASDEELSWGQTLLARELTKDPEIPVRYKPFCPSTVGHWLDSRIYCGELVWDANATGIVADTRVIEPNPMEDIIRVPKFCEPIVKPGVWDKAQALRCIRRNAFGGAPADEADTNGKLILPAAPGLTLKYLLTGLTRCGLCGASMQPNGSGVYVAKSGDERRYTAYVCPNFIAGHCDNNRRVPEAWLREQVVSTLRARLFPWRAE